MSKIFISYRRDDNISTTGRICDRLKAHFGEESVFMDVDAIPLGVDFRQHLIAAVSACDVLLAVIGDQWLTISQSGQPRLQDAADFVRIEIEAALQRGIPVIPVLLGKTAMPRENELPVSMANLAFRNALPVDLGADFHHHVDKLIRGLKKLAAKAPAAPAAKASAAPVEAQAARPALPKTQSPAERGPPLVPGEIDITVAGEWEARTANDPDASWHAVCHTPAKVRGVPGKAYSFLVEELTDEGLAGLNFLMDLATFQRLDLKCQQIGDGDLAHLKGFKNLQSLSLSGCQGITNGGLVHLKDLTNLQRLVLAQCEQISNEGLAHLKEFTHLQPIHLWDCDGIGDGGLALLKDVPNLRSLRLCLTQLSDAGLVHLKDFPKLRVLDIFTSEGISDAGLLHLKRLSNLQELSLPSKIGDAGLVHLKGLSNLQRLDFSGTEISEVGMVHLKDHPNLQSLGVGNKISDRSLVHVKNLRILESLDVSFCDGISDAGMVHLKRLPHLRSLNLS